MDLKEIASVSGKGGLFRIVKPTRSGVILETLDDKAARMVATASHRISVLKEISIYTTDAEGSAPLEEVFYTIHKEFGDDPGVDSSSSPEELKAFLQHVLPEFDRDRVYVSDIKKLVSWYKILLKYAPDALKESTEKEGTEASTDAKEEARAEEGEKKATAKKASKKEKA
ncbi:DUF5606 family protein [Nafulsella turpanensis]|uniref:DUF5606 family protein n=1 Tax=Nafulsella turpanensis TaxID=1265690 RepID=UPI00034A444E|nr:DUF5606 domain-containing protein [Nafulsella turpanensis]